MPFLFGFVALIAFAFWLYFIKVVVAIDGYLIDKKINLHVDVMIFSLCIFSRDLVNITLFEAGDNAVKSADFHKVFLLVFRLLKKATIKQMALTSTFGMGDAVIDGIFSGFLHSILHLIFATLSRIVRMEQPLYIELYPFAKTIGLEAHLKGILHLRLGNVIPILFSYRAR